MTVNETKQFVFKVINTMLAKKCYVKGYGNQFRVMDEKHNPEINISKEVMRTILDSGVIKKEGVIFILNKDQNPFKTFHEVVISKE